MIHSNLKEEADLFYFFPFVIKKYLLGVFYVLDSVHITEGRVGNKRSPPDLLELVI